MPAGRREQVKREGEAGERLAEMTKASASAWRKVLVSGDSFEERWGRGVRYCGVIYFG